MNSKRFKLRYLYLVAYCIFFVAGSVNAKQHSLKPFTAEYQLEKSGIVIAQVTMSLRQHNDIWHYKTLATPKGFAALLSKDEIQQYSQLKIDNGSLQPIEYLETERRTPKTHITYRDKNAVEITHNGQKNRLQLDKPHYDLQTLQLLIMHNLLNGQTVKTYNIIDDAKLKTYHFEMLGEEQLALNTNKINTVKLSRNQNQRETISWHAVDFNYLPIQINKYKKGKLKSSMKLISHHFD